MRRRLLVLAIALAVLAGGGVATWQWLTATVRDAVEGWAAAQRAQGYDVAWQGLDVRGPPWRLTSHIDGAKFGRQEPGLAWSWSPPPLALDVFPPRFDEFALAAGGLHHVDVAVDGRPYRVILAAADADARLRLDDNGLVAAFAGEVAELSATIVDEPFELKAAAGEIAVQRPPENGVESGPSAPASLRAMARFDDVVLPVVPTGPFGRTVTLIGAEAELRGIIPAASPAVALERWRADGGTIEVERLELVWGPLSAVAEGTVALDAELQPVGALVARVRGLTQAIDALELAGMIDQRTARFTRIAVLAFSRIPDGGGAPELQVPVTVQDRRLLLGPVALLTLPRVEWP